jgi:hypothetical protein
MTTETMLEQAEKSVRAAQTRTPTAVEAAWAAVETARASLQAAELVWALLLAAQQK